MEKEKGNKKRRRKEEKKKKEKRKEEQKKQKDGKGKGKKKKSFGFKQVSWVYLQEPLRGIYGGITGEGMCQHEQMLVARGPGGHDI